MESFMDLYSDRSEKVRYNTSDYPVYIRKELLSQYPNYSAVSHWHDDVELIVVLSGQMQYNVNGSIVMLKQGEGIFVNARQIHYGFSDHRTECDFICVLLHPMLLCISQYIEQKYVAALINNSAFPFCVLHDTIAWESAVLEIVKQMLLCADSPSSVLKIQSLFYSVWSELFEHAPEGRKPPARRCHQFSALKDMIGYIQKNYCRKILLDEIAAAGSVCKSTCCNIFQSYLKQTPTAYLTDFRLKKSIDLMQSTDMTITEICYKVGFSGASYYTETFRKYFGCGPREYRKQRL